MKIFDFHIGSRVICQSAEFPFMETGFCARGTLHFVRLTITFCVPCAAPPIACLLYLLIVATMSSFSRRGSLMPKPPPTQLIRNEDPEKTKERMLRGPTAGAWKKIGVGKHFGMCVPLFGLKTKESCGIGEYLDLIPMGMITSTSSLLPNTVLCLSSSCTHFFC